MNILIIDDDHDFAEMLKESLEDAPDLFVVNILSSREAASNFFNTAAFQTIGCVLLDLQFPQQTGETQIDETAGMQVLRDLRKVYGFQKTVIVMTSSTKISDAQRGLAEGCDGYMMKCGTVSDAEAVMEELRQALSSEDMSDSIESSRIFWRDRISPKEARMLNSLLEAPRSEIAEDSDCYDLISPHMEADRIFDKLLSQQSVINFGAPMWQKRQLALNIWKNKRQQRA